MSNACLSKLYDAERERLLLLRNSKLSGAYECPVFGQGPDRPFLVLIGEAPGAEETKQSRPFVGKAGRQLDELLSLARIPRDEVYITNAVKYRPIVDNGRTTRNRTPNREEIEASLPLLRAELLALEPQCIATLGNVPLLSVLSLCKMARQVIGDAHGRPQHISLEDWTADLFPLYHPASAIYNRSLLETCRDDACRLGEHYAVNKR